MKASSDPVRRLATLNQIPATQREFVEALVEERWYMLTMDTVVDDGGVGTSDSSEFWDQLRELLQRAMSRLAADGFEGDVHTQTVVDRMMDRIGEDLCAAAVEHRIAHEPSMAVAS